MDGADLSIKRVLEYEDRFREGKRIMNVQDIFDGVKLEVMKAFDQGFQIVHSIKMGGHYEMGMQKQKAKERARLQGGSKDQYIYEFTATYVGDRFLMIGRIDTHDRMMGRFQHVISKNFNYRLIGQTIEEHSAAIIESTIKPSLDSIVTVKAISWTQFSAAYMQLMSPKLSLGCELVYNSKQQWATNEFTVRYVPQSIIWIPMEGYPHQYQDGRTQLISKEVFILSVGSAKHKKVIGPSIPGESLPLVRSFLRNIGSVTMGYAKKVNRRCTMASTLKFTKMGADKWDSSFKMGMEYSLPMIINFKSQISSNGSVTSLLDDTIGNNLRISLASKVNYFKSIYRFGLSFNLYA